MSQTSSIFIIHNISNGWIYLVVDNAWILRYKLFWGAYDCWMVDVLSQMKRTLDDDTIVPYFDVQINEHILFGLPSMISIESKDSFLSKTLSHLETLFAFSSSICRTA